MKTPLFLAALSLSLGCVTLSARTWTSADGRTLEADFLSVSGEQVTLRRASDRKTFTLKLATLSEADQSFVAEQAAAPGLPSGEKIPVEAKAKFAGKVTGDWEKMEFGSLQFRFYGGADLNGAETYPLVIFLHGKGSGGTDNEKQLGSGPKSFAKPENYAERPCFILAPQCPDDSKGWNGGIQDDLFKLIDEAMDSLPIDKKRIYITGLSMGGYGTWAALGRDADLFAAAIPVCGGGNPGNARAMKKVAIWNFHGDADPTVPVEQSRSMVEALERAHANIKYTELPGVGHNAWDSVYPDVKVHEWLFEQKQK